MSLLVCEKIKKCYTCLANLSHKHFPTLSSIQLASLQHCHRDWHSVA